MKQLLAASAAAATLSLGVPGLGGPVAAGRAAIVLHLHAPAALAFSMFDPVNEARWAPGWHPTFIGEACVGEGLVFTTTDEHGRTAWLLDRYDPHAYVLRYVVAHPATLTTIDVAVVGEGPQASVATVTYTRTALDPAAASAVEAFVRHFPAQGPHWESAINAALASEPGG